MKVRKKLVFILMMIVCTTFFVSCSTTEKTELIDFRARVEAFINVQTETLVNYIDGKLSKEEFGSEQMRNITFLKDSVNSCPSEYAEMYNSFLVSLENFKNDSSSETYDKYKSTLDNLYLSLTKDFNQYNVKLDNKKIKEYEDLIKL